MSASERTSALSSSPSVSSPSIISTRSATSTSAAAPAPTPAPTRSGRSIAGRIGLSYGLRNHATKRCFRRLPPVAAGGARGGTAAECGETASTAGRGSPRLEDCLQGSIGLGEARERGWIAPIEEVPQALDADGCLTNTASLDAVGEPWRSVAMQAAGALAATLRERGLECVGVALRGSLPRGRALKGLSDIDLIAHYVHGPGFSSDDRIALRADLRAVGRRMCAAHSGWCTKIEMVAHGIPKGSLLAERLEEAADKCLEAAGSCDESVEKLPYLAWRDLKGAFLLKTQAVCVRGQDIGALLPAAAGRPPVTLLPRLSGDVEAADDAMRPPPLDAASQLPQQQQLPQQPEAAGTTGEIAPRVRALRWGLKRCIRAAAELAMQARIARVPDAGLAATETDVYTRDLYWCTAQGSSYLQTHADHLVTALLIYVHCERLVLDGRHEHGLEPGRAGHEVLHEGGAVMRRLASAIDRAFLHLMLRPDAGWLTMTSASAPASGASVSTPPRAEAAKKLPLWVRNLATGATTATGNYDVGAVRGQPPVTACNVVGEVRVLTWPDDEDEVADRCGRFISDVTEGRLERLEPLLIRGGAAHWGGVGAWSLSTLAAEHGDMGGSVRVAPSLAFPFVEPQLLDLYLKSSSARGGWLHGPPPSMSVPMSMSEFALRMQAQSSLPHLVYEPEEYYYMQADIPPKMAAAIDLASPPFAALLGGGDMRQSQPARVWISGGGAVSPLHYDLSTSVLVQAAGEKRMLLYSPESVPSLHFYPDMHMLRRRSRVNVVTPDGTRFPEFSQLRAIEARLEAGDALLFPPLWAHYTESHGTSISVTARFAPLR